jgi:hypothetical protein
VEEDWPTSIRSSRRVQGWAWQEEGVAGGGVITAAEAAARRSSSARGFPARRAAKLESITYSRRRGSYWGGRIGRRRGGGRGLTATGAHRRGGKRRRLGSGEGLASGWGCRASVWSGEPS